jgi:hypothetical protein
VVPSQTPPHELPSLAQAVLAPPFGWTAPLTVVQVPSLPATSQASH